MNTVSWNNLKNRGLGLKNIGVLSQTIFGRKFKDQNKNQHNGWFGDFRS